MAGHGANRIPLIEVTGAEPLLQPETPALAEKLLAAGCTVMIETSGERFVGVLPREVIKIVDVKYPDSSEPGAPDTANLEVLDRKDEVKFVMTTRRDTDFARDFAKRDRLAERVHQVLLLPVFADPHGKWLGSDARELANWILADGLPVRLGMQLHKLIWIPQGRDPQPIRCPKSRKRSCS